MDLPAKYTEIKPLAPGQNALVFAARDTLLDRRVFLKAYKIPEDDPNSALSEPQMLEALAHENLTKIHSADEIEDGHLLLGMELVTGGSYNDLVYECQRTGIWTSSHRVLNLIADSANGLGHLHRNHFVHRDVKPANLMRRLTDTSEQGVVTDLGMASRLNEAGKAYASEHARLYRPPEVWQGHGYTPGSDIYQLGIVLFQMLGGQLDFSLGKLPDAELSAVIINQKLLKFETLPPHISNAMRRLIGKCVCPQSQRFAEVSQLIVDMNNIRAKEPDWIFSQGDETSTIVRDDGDGRVYRFTVESDGARHEVSREKKVNGGVYRRDGKPVVINHKQIGSSRDFTNMVNS